MKAKKSHLFLFFCFALSVCNAQQVYKVFLVGDAGEDQMTGETLDSLKSKMQNSAQGAVVFLGDNSYKNTFFGLVEGFKGFDSSRITQNKLKSQLNTLDGYKGSVFFVPGNHDWWNTTYTKGKKALKMEESFIEANLSNNTTIQNPNNVFLPKNGSPGPESVELNNKTLRIVFIDTEWLILLGFKSTPAANHTMEQQFYTRLDSVLAAATAAKQTIIVVAHHPVYTTGKLHNKPFKSPGFMKRIKQSSKSFPSYKTMADKLTAIFEKYPGLYYATGHLHALQYHTLNNVHYIISGSGSKTKHMKGENIAALGANTNDDYMIWNEKGFFEIDFSGGQTTTIMYYNSGKESATIH
jgi:hypothetical protein